jgi:DNA-binding response OmpR family regulator
MKILLAEDDLFFQNFYSRKLTEAGFQVEVAGDGNEALQKLMVVKPDIVLLDLIMPNKDGFEVLTEISKHQSLQSIPIIIFSTLGQNSDVEKAKKLGATDYVNKTFFNFDNLLAKVNQTMNNVRQ